MGRLFTISYSLSTRCVIYFPQRAQDTVDASERYYHGTRNHGPEGSPSTVWPPRGETSSPANQTQISLVNTCRVPDFFFQTWSLLHLFSKRRPCSASVVCDSAPPSVLKKAAPES